MPLRLINYPKRNVEDAMTTNDRCCTIVPYFDVHEMEAFKALCVRFIEKTSNEPKCLYYGFSFSENQAHCREGYEDAAGVLAHLENIGPLFEEALKLADLTRLEIHGPEDEVSQLREPLAELNPQYFVLEYGFRR
jgi:quinol monooxygenase YgiN